MDKAQRDAYQRARDAVIAAHDRMTDNPSEQAALALADAAETLEAATAPIAGLVQAAWDRNIAKLQAAKAAVVDAVAAQVAVEVECGNAARARNPAHPVYTADELDRCQQATAATAAARQAVIDAGTAFKAGVTVEQLDEVAG